MAALVTTHPTLLDLARRQDPNGKIAQIVELFTQVNDILPDMAWVEGNLETGHRSTVRTGLPAVTWRKLYGGVQPSKSSTAQVTDSCGMLEAYAEVDKALADLNGNTAAWRMSEEFAFIEALNQQMASTVFYGNEGTTPEAFTGFAPRFNSTSAANGSNIIRANTGSTPTDNQSIWLIGWGPNTVHGIIPKGSKAGIQIEDKGQVTVENVDGSNGRAEMYRTHYRWDAGLTVRDWRYIVRIADISKALLKADASSGPVLPDLMFQAMERIQSLSGVRPVFYTSRTVLTTLRQQLASQVKNATLGVQNVGGVLVHDFQGIPIRRVDALAADEAYVS